MGRTSKPVRILVLDEDLFKSPEVQALADKGHPITWWVPGLPVVIGDYDLVIGRRAWYMDTKHLPYLEKLAIPAARERITNREKAENKK